MPNDPAVTRARYLERRANGVCVGCGSRPADDGLTMCASCRFLHAQARTRSLAAKIERGECLYCPSHSAEGDRLCPVCREKKRARAKRDHLKRYHARKAAGRCPMCNLEPVPGHTLCALHISPRKRGAA